MHLEIIYNTFLILKIFFLVNYKKMEFNLIRISFQIELIANENAKLIEIENLELRHIIKVIEIVN